MLLESRNILITGAGQGIGRGIAEAVVKSGGNVALLDLNGEAVGETARLVEGAGRRALPLVGDVTDERSVARVFEETAERLGRLDGLVNNAGTIQMNSVLDASREEWDRQFDVNVRGVFLCCQYAARRMIAQGEGGVIVNVASNAGKVGYPNMAIYNASKAAVINLTRTLAAEWAEQGINVNAVCPGGVETPMLKGAAEWVAKRVGADVDQLYESMKPSQMARHIQPIDVGRVVAFLLSDRARIIRGQSINVDGGDTPY
jgi:NAD(P)-dependent dehydrogenase (short-subunit alcohol dehydrogenase family)